MNTNVKNALAWGVPGLLIGGAVGFFVSKKILEAYYIEITESAIQEVKDHYRIIRKDGDLSDPLNSVTVDITEDDSDVNDEDISEDSVPEKQGFRNKLAEDRVEYNLFSKPHPEQVRTEEEVKIDEDFVDEYDPIRDRDTTVPYIITFNEFMQYESDGNFQESSTVTYFEGDDTLMDDAEHIIPDPDSVINVKNLAFFGVGSEDPSIVYVRNEKIGIDFEIVKDERDYAEVVLGIRTNDDEPRKGVRKNRDDD